MQSSFGLHRDKTDYLKKRQIKRWKIQKKKKKMKIAMKNSINVLWNDDLYIYVAGFNAYDKGGMDLRKFGKILLLFYLLRNGLGNSKNITIISSAILMKNGAFLQNKSSLWQALTSKPFGIYPWNWFRMKKNENLQNDFNRK